MNKKKDIRPIFQRLVKDKISFAVIAAVIKMKAMPDFIANDYCIIGSSVKDKKELQDMGFYQLGSHDLVMERNIEHGTELNTFKKMLANNEFKLVQNDENGKIWEYHTVNNFATYCGSTKTKKGGVEV